MGLNPEKGVADGGRGAAAASRRPARPLTMVCRAGMGSFCKQQWRSEYGSGGQAVSLLLSSPDRQSGQR